MKIAVVNEVSAADRNEDILNALDGSGHEVINVGMPRKAFEPQLQYIHTGFLSALLLNTGKADFVVGGCGTGQGFLNSVMQFPGVFCGLISSPLDAWLFGQINGGNCISLALNQGYGWAGDVNLKFLFERLFSVEFGCGYPPERQAPQQASRKKLMDMSAATHLPMGSIIEALDTRIVSETLDFPGVRELLDLGNMEKGSVRDALLKY